MSGARSASTATSGRSTHNAWRVLVVDAQSRIRRPSSPASRRSGHASSRTTSGASASTRLASARCHSRPRQGARRATTPRDEPTSTDHTSTEGGSLRPPLPRPHLHHEHDCAMTGRGVSLRLLGLVRAMPADEAALLAGVGQCLEPTLERLEHRAAVQKDPCLAAAHRAFALFVHDLRAHGAGSIPARCNHGKFVRGRASATPQSALSLPD